MFYKYRRRGIEPNTGLNPFLKIALYVICMHKTDLIHVWQVIIGIIPDPGDHESNFKKMGAIAFSQLSKGTDDKLHQIKSFSSIVKPFAGVRSVQKEMSKIERKSLLKLYIKNIFLYLRTRFFSLKCKNNLLIISLKLHP